MTQVASKLGRRQAAQRPASDRPAIERVYEHHGFSQVAMHRAIVAATKSGERPPAVQRLSEYLSRGWASPSHAPVIARVAPAGVTLEDLIADRARARLAATSS